MTKIAYSTDPLKNFIYGTPASAMVNVIYDFKKA